MRYAFSKHGGNLGESGCVSWMFEAKGLFIVDPETNERTEEELLTLAMEAGAEDLREENGALVVVTAPGTFETVRAYLEKNKVPLASSTVAMVSKNTVEVKGHEAEQLLRLVEVLEENEDVQNVYGNFVLPD